MLFSPALHPHIGLSEIIIAASAAVIVVGAVWYFAVAFDLRRPR